MAPVDPSSSFIIKVIDYRDLDEGILRCGERRSKRPFFSPAEKLFPNPHWPTIFEMPRSRELTGDHRHVDRCRGTLHAPKDSSRGRSNITKKNKKTPQKRGVFFLLIDTTALIHTV